MLIWLQEKKHAQTKHYRYLTTHGTAMRHGKVTLSKDISAIEALVCRAAYVYNRML